MHYVYMIRSQVHPEETYIGLTSDLKLRMAKHNEGGSPHTAKYKPWSLVNYLAFSSRQQARQLRSLFEIRLRASLRGETTMVRAHPPSSCLTTNRFARIFRG
jgi:predicted GIY-YIG superfamily endonuclease